MMERQEWIGLADAVHEINGLVTYWEMYSLAVQNRIESRRRGARWQVRRDSLDQYLGQLRLAVKGK
jgi:hypothetical protein